MSDALPEPIRSAIGASLRGAPLLHLEPPSSAEKTNWPWMIAALTVPIVAALFTAGPEGDRPSLGMIVLLLAILSIAPALIYRALSKRPSDIVLASDGLHLCWRRARDVKHRFIPFEDIAALEDDRDWTGKILRSILRLRSGERVRLTVMVSARGYGPIPLYAVRLNTISIALDARADQAFHAELKSRIHPQA
jgi:hypothetical protein